MESASLGSSFSMVSRMVFGGRIQPIQQIGHALQSGIGAAALLAQGFQAFVQRQRNPLRHLRRELPQLRQPLDGLGAQRLGQTHQQGRSLFGVQVRQDQRDGLGMLAFEKLRQLLRIGFLQRIELAGAHLARPA